MRATKAGRRQGHRLKQRSRRDFAVIASAAKQSPARREPGWGLLRRFAPNKKKGVVCSQVPLWQNFFIHGGSAAAGRWLTRNHSETAGRPPFLRSPDWPGAACRRGCPHGASRPGWAASGCAGAAQRQGERHAVEPRVASEGLSRHGHDPPLRGARAGRILQGRHSRVRASLCRPGSLRGRRLLASRAEGPYRQHASRAWPQHRQGLRRHRHDEGAVRQAGRAVRRQRRLDAYRRSGPGHAGRQRHRRRRAAAGGGRRADRQDAAVRQRCGGVHRRRRLQPGHHVRGDEPGGGAAASGDLRVREQRLRRIHRRRLRRRQPRHRRTRRAASACRPRRSAATISSPCTKRRARRSSAPAAAAAPARSRSIPAASTAIIPATHSSIAPRTRCARCARNATA